MSGLWVKLTLFSYPSGHIEGAYYIQSNVFIFYFIFQKLFKNRFEIKPVFWDIKDLFNKSWGVLASPTDQLCLPKICLGSAMHIWQDLLIPVSSLLIGLYVELWKVLNFCNLMNVINMHTRCLSVDKIIIYYHLKFCIYVKYTLRTFYFFGIKILNSQKYFSFWEQLLCFGGTKFMSFTNIWLLLGFTEYYNLLLSLTNQTMNK